MISSKLDILQTNEPNDQNQGGKMVGHVNEQSSIVDNFISDDCVSFTNQHCAGQTFGFRHLNGHCSLNRKTD